MYGFWSCVMSHPGHLLCLLEYLTLRTLYWPSVLGPAAAVAVCVGCGPLIAPSLSPSACLCGACPAGPGPHGEMGYRRGMMTVHYRGLSQLLGERVWRGECHQARLLRH